MAWDGDALIVEFNERSAPLPWRVKGRIRLKPSALCHFVTSLDAKERHRWGPIAPCARIDVQLEQPGVSWSGPAYMDSNEGDEAIENAFVDWDWSRARLHDGSTAVIYDVRPSIGPGRVIAQRFAPDGTTSAFEPPARQRLPSSKWLVARSIRTEQGPPARVLETLEDTPFYVRSTLASGLLGEQVISIHESLSIPRLVSLPVRLMLPWRMPRLA